jgi:hypothetical protein
LPRADDDQQANVVVITEWYRIPEFWNNRERQFGAHRISEEVTKPNIARRTAPLAVSHPVNIMQSIEVQMPEPLSISKDSQVISDGFIRYEFREAMVGSTLKLDYTYKSLAGEVPASQVAKHLAVVEKIRNTLGYSIGSSATMFEMSGSSQKSKISWLNLLIGLFTLGGILGLVLYLRRRQSVPSLRAETRSRQFKDKLQVAPGGSPETAIPLAYESALLSSVGSLRCACGEIYYKEGAPLYRQGLTYDGRRLILVQLLCERCRQPRDVYYAPPLVRGQG